MKFINIDHRDDVYNGVNAIVESLKYNSRRRIIILVYTQKCPHCVSLLKDSGVWNKVMNMIKGKKQVKNETKEEKTKKTIVIKCNYDVLSDCHELLRHYKGNPKVESIINSTSYVNGVPSLYKIRKNNKIVNMKEIMNVENIQKFMKIKI